MKYVKTMLMALALLTFSSFLYAQNRPINTSTDAFRLGYVQGYVHGESDREMGVDFSYQHDHRFQAGISNNSYTNAKFRAGYKDGYTDAYSGRMSRQFRDSDYNYDSNYYSNDDFDDETRYYTAPGFVTVYEDEEFDGNQRQLQPGRYPDLDDNWDDEIESVQLNGDVRVILFDEEDFKGQRLVLESSISDLDELNFRNRAESMIIQPLR